MTKETNKTRPTHRVYAVSKNGDDGRFWQPIGALWAHNDARGFNGIRGIELAMRSVIALPRARLLACGPTRSIKGETGKRFCTSTFAFGG